MIDILTSFFLYAAIWLPLLYFSRVQYSFNPYISCEAGLLGAHCSVCLRMPVVSYQLVINLLMIRHVIWYGRYRPTRDQMMFRRLLRSINWIGNCSWWNIFLKGIDKRIFIYNMKCSYYNWLIRKKKRCINVVGRDMVYIATDIIYIPGTLCNIGYPTEMHLKPKFCEDSFVHD